MKIKERLERDSIHGPNIKEAKTGKDKAIAYWKGLKEWKKLTKKKVIYHLRNDFASS